MCQRRCAVNRGQNNQMIRSMWKQSFCMVGLLFVWLLMNGLMTVAVIGNGGPLSSKTQIEPASSPSFTRSEAERAGHLAVLRTGGNSGLQFNVRTGRTGLSHVQRLQSNAYSPELFIPSEPVPSCPFRIEFSNQSCLFQLFPRSSLPVRAGPVSLS